MAQFDLHPEPDGSGYLLDCQSDLLSHLNTRLVVPVRRPDDAPIAGARLNPQFEILGKPFIMVTQFAAAVPLNALGEATRSLADERDRIIGAVDMLLTGI